MTYKINDQKVFLDITDGIAILIEVDTGIYYGFNVMTTNIFENIISGVDTDDILDKMHKIEGFNDEIENKYKALLNILVEKEFIIESYAEKNQSNIKIDKFINDESDFVMSEYCDAMEILLADPIHHVKKDTGWKPNIGSLK